MYFVCYQCGKNNQFTTDQRNSINLRKVREYVEITQGNSGECSLNIWTVHRWSLMRKQSCSLVQGAGDTCLEISNGHGLSPLSSYASWQAVILS